MKAMEVGDPLLPLKAEVVGSSPMTGQERLVKVRLESPGADGFTYKPGQFVKLGVMGVGEAPISLCSDQGEDDVLEFCIRNVGRVTSAIHRLPVGGTIWVRGPYGNGFPMERLEGMDLLLVAGGLGIAPIRGVLQYVLNHRERYGEVSLLYGVRCFDLMLFKDEVLGLFREGDKQGVRLYLSYEDSEDEECNALRCEREDRCLQGMVTSLFGLWDGGADNTAALIGGPPIMYRFVIKELEALCFNPGDVYMTLERRMRCGVGQCGHCIVGSGRSIRYVCKDGPVFTLWDAYNTRGMI